jgi:hypothetical protein
MGDEVTKPEKPGIVKSRLQSAFLRDLYEDWLENGRAAIRIVRDEEPASYFKTVASLMPREVADLGGAPLIVQIVNYADAEPKTIEVRTRDADG